MPLTALVRMEFAALFSAIRQLIFKLILVVYFLCQLLPDDVIRSTAEAFASKKIKRAHGRTSSSHPCFACKNDTNHNKEQTQIQIIICESYKNNIYMYECNFFILKVSANDDHRKASERQRELQWHRIRIFGLLFETFKY